MVRAMLGACCLAGMVALQGDTAMVHQIEAVPDGYHLIAYDDCGVRDRQPHVRCEGVHTYSEAHVAADERTRSVAWGWKEVGARFDQLRPDISYVIAVTYANEPFNARVQSLYAGDVALHGPRALPKGGWERLVFMVPHEAIQDGVLDLRFRLEGPVNVVVSAIELWAPLPPPKALHLTDVSALWKDLEGRALDLAWNPVAGARVTLLRRDAPDAPIAVTETDAEGMFVFKRDVLIALPRNADLLLRASSTDACAEKTVSASDIWFDPIRYRPIPAAIHGLRACVRTLDGSWRMRAGEPAAARGLPLGDHGWRRFKVPGQWLQQGLDVPLTEPVSVATEFPVPAEWRGRRVILRFDAVHGGTQYWLNGVRIGSSENLFTPVEWDVTEQVLFGQPNRLDMEMIVQTESERLAHASGYAFHSLGGIPRSVRIFALPATHLRSLRISAGLDRSYQSGLVEIMADIEGPDAERAVIRSRVLGTDGSHMSQPSVRSRSLSFSVPGIRPWTNETPNLYTLQVELIVGSRVLERITRKIGFRTVEVRGSQLLLNGKPIKLAGACRHETDPLTGRADTARHARRDVVLMKQANLNYIRTAHYPPTQELLDEADRQGMLVEVEAPFCWVGNEGFYSLRAILTPTSAMVDYHHWHPSVIIWSLANESTFNPCFEVSNRLVKELDPTRPTTFNNPAPKRICDIANVHYPRMPFDDYDRDDPRPLLLGEYFFPICHEQTDVRRNPGLRELWGAGHSDPTSDYGKACAREFSWPYTQPGEPPGAWTHIVESRRVIGGAIWAMLDEPFYLPGGKQVGYAWVHGFWGLVDGWRRPKPEHWLARQIFSPVWFPVRRLPFTPGQQHVEIPVENRFAFTDLDRLEFRVRCGRRLSVLRTSGAPGHRAALSVPIPSGANAGDELACEVVDAAGRSIVTATMWLGEPALPRPCKPQSDAVAVPDAPEALGDAAAWPTFHVTRFDFADLWTAQPPFAVLPDGRPETAVTLRGTSLIIRQKWPGFEGAVIMTPDASGAQRIAYEFVNNGADFFAREIGLRIPLKGHDWTLSWDRWCEWGDAPADSIMRRRGVAKPFRGKSRSRSPESVRPRWPWDLDETEEGTADFRSVKLNIYQAALQSSNGPSLTVYGHGDVHVRAAVEGRATAFYLLSRCAIGPLLVRTGDTLKGDFLLEVKNVQEVRKARR
ncbi:MAG: hypothetical protein GX446_09045 [Chthonomonadales bacterium]|nr:hypothetical protein [Chthonomonadales bacterium]